MYYVITVIGQEPDDQEYTENTICYTVESRNAKRAINASLKRAKRDGAINPRVVDILTATKTACRFIDIAV